MIFFGLLWAIFSFAIVIARFGSGYDAAWASPPWCFVVSALCALVVMMPRGLGAEGRRMSRILSAERKAIFDSYAAVHGPHGAQRIIELEMKETRFGLTRAEERELWAYAAIGAKKETARPIHPEYKPEVQNQPNDDWFEDLSEPRRRAAE